MLCGARGISISVRGRGDRVAGMADKDDMLGLEGAPKGVDRFPLSSV
jgi:hypothetical protein